MTVKIIDELNKKYSFENEFCSLKFKVGVGNIPVVEIKNKQSSAVISLQGAHLLSWEIGFDNVIWLSEDAVFQKKKSIRGGIPVCWPWFGAHESNADFPAHGFARTEMWEVVDTKNISDAESQITFKLSTNQLSESVQNMWPQDTVLEYRITVSEKLTLELVTINNSKENITIGQALHTYFDIGDINNTTVHGLEGKTYLDKTDGFKEKIQNGDVKINSEVDRVYLDTADDLVIDNRQRKIILKKEGSCSTIVWNPWKEVAEKMGDLGENGYLQMLCVESANTENDVVTIKPNSGYTLKVMYEIEI